MEIEEIQQISDILDKIEGAVCGEEVQTWIEKICKEDMGLISYLLKNISLETSSSQLFIKVLKQLSDFCFNEVSSEIEKSGTFILKLINYVSKTEPSQVNMDILHMFLKVYNENSSDLDITKEIFLNILGSLEFVQSEKTIILIISFIQETIASYSAEFFSNKNSQLIIELLLLNFNRSEGLQKVKFLETISFILVQKIDCLYTNDFVSLCNMILQVFENQEELVYNACLDVLSILFGSEELVQKNYRLDEFKEIFESLDEVKFSKYKSLLLSKI